MSTHETTSDKDFVCATMEQLFDHPDFWESCDYLKIDPKWVRDNNSHIWINDDVDETGDCSVMIHNSWTVEADIDKYNALHLFGTLYAKDTDIDIFPDMVINESYMWWWTKEKGFEYRLDYSQ